METTTGYVRIMEEEMTTSIVFWGYIAINGKGHGNYYCILRLYWQHGKGHGNYYSMFGGYIGITGKKMETAMGLALRAYSPPSVDRVWVVWGSSYNVPKAIFYRLKGDYDSMQRKHSS